MISKYATTGHQMINKVPNLYIHTSKTSFSTPDIGYRPIQVK